MHRRGTGGGHSECSYEPLGSIKCWEFLDYLKTCKHLKKDFAPWSKYIITSVLKHTTLSWEKKNENELSLLHSTK